MVATTIDEDAPARRTAKPVSAPPRPVAALRPRLGELMPKGLFARSLIIIIAPVVLLQALVAFVFMERNWQAVTRACRGDRRRDIAAVVDIIETYPQDGRISRRSRRSPPAPSAQCRAVLPPEPLPPAGPKPFFDSRSTGFSAGRSPARSASRSGSTRSAAPTSSRSASSSPTTSSASSRAAARPTPPTRWSSSRGWSATSAILLAIAIVFLRNQIRPILRLTAAVDDFGKGRAVADFQPRGAREVRQATIAFHEMRERVERQIEQRTAMLAGVSHDLRTMLTRLRLQLALIEDSADVDALKNDVDDMNRMLDGYLAFARGDSDEETVPTDIAACSTTSRRRLGFRATTAEASFTAIPIVRVRPQSFKRCLANLVGNAGRHGSTVAVSGRPLPTAS
jgi:two-component system, OmpR family, osmolarity sensor histidine kinase EnvZ